MKLFKKILSHTLPIIARVVSFPSLLLPSKWLRNMNSDQRRFFNLIVTGVILVAGTWVATSLLSPDRSEASWFNDNWQYRQTVPVSNSGSTLTNAQVPITLDTATLVTAGKMKSDCSDTRITNMTGDILTHWVHECNTATTKIYAWADIPSGSSELLLYYGNPSARDVEVITGTPQFPGISCKTILDHGDGSTNQQYTIDPNAGSVSDAFSSYCDMTTDSGGWTIVTSQNGTTSQEGLTSNTEVSGNPFSNASHNVSTQKKQDLSLISSESLIKRSTGIWLKADDPLFDGNLTTASQHSHYSPVTLTANDGTQVTDAVMGYSNYNNAGGGDFGITTSVGFDHHSTNYYHLRSGCGSHYFYKYGTTYNVNTTLGSWTQTTACSNNSTAMGPWYAGMRGTIAPTIANLTISSPTNEEKSPGPTAYWALDEGTGTIANDSTQNKNAGTITGATWRSQEECIVEKCLFFTGTNNVNVPDPTNNSLDFGTGDFTISVWIKTGIAADHRNLIRKGAGNGYSGWRFGLSNGIPNILLGDTSGFAAGNLGTTSIADNRWHLLTVVYDRDSNAIGYVDGVQVGVRAISAYQGSVDNTSSVILGNSYATFTGFLDEVRMYPYALTPDQIQKNYNAGVAAVLGAKDANLNEGLVGHWAMDNNVSGNTQTLTDSSGNGNSGTTNYGGNTTGMDCTTDGKYGKGCTLDGIDDYIDLGSGSSIANVSNQLSAGVWVNATSAGGVIYRGGIGGTPWHHLLQIESASQLRVRLWEDGTGTGTSFTVTGLSLFNTWNHLFYTYDGRTVKVYVNGELKSSTSYSSTIGTGANTWLGQYPSGGTRYLTGTLDEVRIYNRSLSLTEVKQLYNYAPPPIYYTPLEEGSGATVNDLSGNGYTGSIIGSTPRWTQGKYGRALQFTNASADRVSANTTSGPLTYLNNHTVGFWVKFTDLNDGTYRTVFNHQPTGSDRSPGIWTHASAGTLRLHWLANPGNQGFGTLGTNGNGGTSFDTNKWYYLTVTKEGTIATAYVNGKKVGTGVMPATMDMGTGIIRFGGGAGMIIDEIKVYDYSRTSSQIIEDMNAGHPIGGSPVGSQTLYLDFDENTGTIANDKSLDPANGTLSCQGTGCILPQWTKDGKFNTALFFDGSNTANNPTITISASTHIKLRTLGDVTISTWIKPSSSYADTSQAILRNGQGSDQEYSLYYNGSSQTISFSWYDGAFKSVAAPSGLVTHNQWSHVAAVRSGTTVYFYVNGRQVSSSTVTAPTVNAAQLSIGRTNNTGVPQDYSGYIDELKIYTTALTEDQIKIDYNSGQSLQFGTLGTDASGNPSNALDRAYCPPGDTTTTCGPIAEWLFEERQGTSASDTSGSGLTGTLTNSPSWTTGKVGSALQFNGTTNYVDSAGVDTSSGNFSLSAWIYPTTTNASWKHIFGAESTGHALGIDGTNTLKLTRVSLSDATTSGYQPPLNTWTYVTATFNDTTDELVYYANGKKITAVTYGGTMPNAGTKTRYIGRSPNYTSYFPGKIDEARIYNYVLSPSQVAWQYNRGEPVAYYDLDECQGTTIHSFTKPYNSALNGTLTIGATGTQTTAGTCQTSGTAWGNGASGKVNSSLSFDGTDDYFEISQPSITTSPNLFTVTGWINPTNHDSFFITPNSTGIDQWIGYNGANQRMRVTVAEATDTNQTNIYSSIGSIPNNEWTHYAVVINNRTIKIYLNGILNTQSTVGFDISGWTSNWRIGQRGNSTFWYQGLMDDLKIFNYELTSQQIKTVMNQGAIRFGQ